MGVPHLVQYQGSKRNLASQILQYIPQHISGRFIEPFSGTAAMTIAVAYNQRSDSFIINDLNKPLIELLDAVINDPEKVSTEYTSLWQDQINNKNHYNEIREQFNKTKDPVMFLYLLARCVKGAVRYNSNGEFNQSYDKRRKGTKPETIKNNIFRISKLLKGKTLLYSNDYKTILKMARPGDLIYMDPPYQGVCGNRDSRYFAQINHQEFIHELNILNTRGIDYIVSYDGTLGEKNYGASLPSYLQLKHIHISGGKSAQSTLLGRNESTLESLYISRSLCQYNITSHAPEDTANVKTKISKEVS